jgi:hypothetical protein
LGKAGVKFGHRDFTTIIDTKTKIRLLAANINVLRRIEKIIDEKALQE